VPDTHRIEVEGALQTGTDELGVYAWIRVDPSVFSQIAVLKAAYWLSERFYLYLARTTDGALLVELRHKTSSGTSEELTSACREFCNSVLDQEVRQHVLHETSAVRDALIRKAFFDVQSPEAALKAQANEGYVPQEHQSFRDDPLGIGLPPQP
jgi:His-Xaa-Ser system protein HxsD